MQRQGGKVQNPGGEPFGFIGAIYARKATVHLDLRTCHDPPPRHVAPNPYPFPLKSRRTFYLPEQTRTLYQQKGYGSKSVPLAHLGPGVQGLAHQRFRRPSQGTLMTKDGPAIGQNSGAQASRES